jgi:hypothetical protein
LAEVECTRHADGCEIRGLSIFPAERTDVAQVAPRSLRPWVGFVRSPSPGLSIRVDTSREL